MKYIDDLSVGGAAAQTRASTVRPIRVSVVMVVFRTGAVLAASLRSAAADPAVDELIIVDNGSTPEEAAAIDAAAADHGHVRVLRGQGNVGFARGANLGARAAQGAVVVFLNPDAFMQSGCVGALTGALRGANALRLVGARILNPDGSEQRGARRGEVTPVTTLLSLTRLAKLAPALRRFEIHREGEALPETPLSVPTVSGACFAMKRSEFLLLGGFDSRYFLHVEDVDLCWRVRRADGEVLFAPEARVIHVGSTSQAHPLSVEYHKGRGLVRYFYKRADTWQRRWLAVGLAPLIMIASLARAALRRRRGELRRAATAPLAR